jgi:hypothetical protein
MIQTDCDVLRLMFEVQSAFPGLCSSSKRVITTLSNRVFPAEVL